VLLLVIYGANTNAKEHWQTLEPGLEMGEFSHRQGDTAGPATIFILRIDPKLWDLKILTSTEFNHKGGLSAKSWAQQHNLTAVINAGMFFTDHSTHAGYMKVDKQIASRGVNRYQSFAVFSPYDSSMAQFRIIDRDTEGVSLNRLRKQYRYLVQNLRLIKRPGINRWQPKGRRWNEAALGEDSRGRALFIYSSNFLSVYQFNQALLRLPIDLVTAQHLEGGSQAQMFINHQSYKREFSSAFKPNFIDQQMSIESWPIPNVIGIIPATER
jgi:hypothetical protein